MLDISVPELRARIRLLNLLRDEIISLTGAKQRDSWIRRARFALAAMIDVQCSRATPSDSEALAAITGALNAELERHLPPGFNEVWLSKWDRSALRVAEINFKDLAVRAWNASKLSVSTDGFSQFWESVLSSTTSSLMNPAFESVARDYWDAAKAE